MGKHRILVSLITTDNDYQQEQATAALDAARRLGVDAEVVYADNDAITQSQQLLNAIHSGERKPDAIICHPVGTALAQVARTAAQKGIGWVVVNREMDYLEELRRMAKAPAFCVTVDQEEVGRIQARQFGALLPSGGIIIYIQGTSGNFSAEKRLVGMQSIKPMNLEVRTLRGNYSEASGYDAIRSWLRLSTSRESDVRLVGAQNDNMAAGARKAFIDDSLTHWKHLIFTGCDGNPTGQEMIRSGALAATIVLPTTAGLAMEMMARALDTGASPTANTVLLPSSLPALEKLGQLAASR